MRSCALKRLSSRTQRVFKTKEQNPNTAVAQISRATYTLLYIFSFLSCIKKGRMENDGAWSYIYLLVKGSRVLAFAFIYIYTSSEVLRNLKQESEKGEARRFLSNESIPPFQRAVRFFKAPPEEQGRL